MQQRPLHTKTSRFIGLMVILSLVGSTAKALALSCACGVVCLIMTQAGDAMPSSTAACCVVTTPESAEVACGMPRAAMPSDAPACHAPISPDEQNSVGISEISPDAHDDFPANLHASALLGCACVHATQKPAPKVVVTTSRPIDDVKLDAATSQGLSSLIGIAWPGVQLESFQPIVSPEQYAGPSLYQIQTLLC